MEHGRRVAASLTTVSPNRAKLNGQVGERVKLNGQVVAKPKEGGRCKWYDPWTKKKCIGTWVVVGDSWRCDPCQQMSGFRTANGYGLNAAERGIDNFFNYLGL
jgi:hypothetical protein